MLPSVLWPTHDAMYRQMIGLDTGSRMPVWELTCLTSKAIEVNNGLKIEEQKLGQRS